MKIWYNNMLESRRYVAELSNGRVRIGRRPDNDIVLDSPFVADEAAVLQRRGEWWELTPLGMNACDVGGRRVAPGERLLLDGKEPVVIFPFQLTLNAGTPAGEEQDRLRPALDNEMSQVIRDMHVQLLSLMDLAAIDDARSQSDEYLLSLENNLDEIARLAGVTEPRRAALVAHVAGHCVRSSLVEQVIERSCQPGAAAANKNHWSRIVSTVPQRETELQVIVDRIWQKLGLDRETDLSRRMDLLEQGFWKCWEHSGSECFNESRWYFALRYLKKQIKDIVFGYGPLEDLLRTPTITEIMVVNSDHIYIEKAGVVENSGRRFVSEEITQTIIERIVSKVGRRIDKSQPLVDARLTDGSRVNAVIPPVAVTGPCLTIRKFPLKRLRVEDLVRIGSLTPTVAEFLRAAVVTRRNIIIAGGTGSGKTTLLNCLADYIPEKERIVTIEDTAELQIDREHVVRMETKQANVEGTGAYTIHDLVRNSLRMRPDRIIVGECRGPEALDMLQAMNTGHDGSLTTIHANSAADIILRLEVMVQSAAPLSLESIHRQIASAIDLVVQLSRMRDGSRRVTQVTEILGVDPDQHGIRTKDLFLLEDRDGKLDLYPTGRLPSFMDRLLDADLIDLDTFFI
jgi:pilus assembly protein CpaF